MNTPENKPWFQSYKVGPFKLPKTMEPYPEIPVFKFLEDSADKYPENLACSYIGQGYQEDITYNDLRTKVNSLTSALATLGVKKGDRVATILPSCPQFIIADYAIMRLGAIHVPLSILHKSREILYELKESGSNIVICSFRRLSLLESIQEDLDLANIIFTPVPLYPDYTTPRISALPDMKNITLHLFEDLLIENTDRTLPEVQIDPKEDLALLPFTGGTTGVPKATMLTHFNLTTNVIQAFHWMLHPLKAGVQGKSSVVVMVPIFHQMGHWMVHACISWGLRILLVDARDLMIIAQTLKKFRPFMAAGVPTHYMLLIDMKIPRMPIFFFSGAAALPEEVASKWEKKIGIPLGEGYGMTESTAVCHLNLSGLSKVTGFIPKPIRAVGIPIPDTDVKLIDIETGENAAFGEPGEIWIRGPQVMKGYWPTSGLGLERDGWLATGDIATMDEQGYFRIVDRVKDMINVSGMKVYSQTVDEILYKHPAVATAGVIGIPDPDRPGSERVKAFISLRPEFVKKVTEEDIINFCRENLPPYAVPQQIEFRKKLPLTAVMKLDKKELRVEQKEKEQEKS
ncbi:MAG: AMP-binding protein [Candidatus Hodarchaeales archaeon]